jgi:hypothetical protein
MLTIADGCREFLFAEVSHGQSPLFALDQVGVFVADLDELA